MEEGDHWGCLSIDGKIILKWILKDCGGVKVWTGFIWCRKQPIGGPLSALMNLHVM
jgi:hypothetical protein